MARILVVDDKQVIHQSLEALLGPLGHTFLHAYNGHQGVAQADPSSSEPPDLIISDLLMPVMNGLEMVTALRESGNTVPIVMYFMDADDQTTIRVCRRAGADEVVGKGLPPSALCSAIARQLAKKVASEAGTEGAQ